MSDIMKITVISDTHGIIDENIVPHLKNSDMIIHAGDIMNTNILKQLESYSDNVVAVAGNNDLPERFSDPEDKEIISKLSKVEQFNVGDDIVTVEHGDRFGHHPSHDDLRFAYPESKLIIYGHTHNQVCDKIRILTSLRDKQKNLFHFNQYLLYLKKFNILLFPFYILL